MLLCAGPGAGPPFSNIACQLRPFPFHADGSFGDRNRGLRTAISSFLWVCFFQSGEEHGPQSIATPARGQGLENRRLEGLDPIAFPLTSVQHRFSGGGGGEQDMPEFCVKSWFLSNATHPAMLLVGPALLVPKSRGGGGRISIIIIFGLAKFGAGKVWHRFLNSMARFGTKFPDCRTRTSLHHDYWLLDAWCYFLEGPDCLLLFPDAFWMLANISWRLLGACCFFMQHKFGTFARRWRCIERISALIVACCRSVSKEGDLCAEAVNLILQG